MLVCSLFKYQSKKCFVFRLYRKFSYLFNFLNGLKTLVATVYTEYIFKVTLFFYVFNDV